jgi:hypothetical protein
MCYTKEVSRNTFIINVVTCLLLFKQKDPQYKILALFFLFVGLMQLFDWIFWETQDLENEKSKTVNYTFTKIAMVVNHLQPLVLAALIYIYKGSISKKSLIPLAIYIISITIYTIKTYPKIDYTLEKENPHTQRKTLLWQWNEQEHSVFVYTMFLLALCSLLFFNFEYPLNIISVIISITSFLAAGYYVKGYTIGRWWCNFACFIPLILLMFNQV